MATIKAYSDLQQSKKLAEILPLESADMYYISGDECDICFGSGVYEEIADWLNNGTSRPADIPCWSLAALLGVLPDPNLLEKDGWHLFCSDTDHFSGSSGYNNPVDACYELILKLHELKML